MIMMCEMSAQFWDSKYTTYLNAKLNTYLLSSSLGLTFEKHIMILLQDRCKKCYFRVFQWWKWNTNGESRRVSVSIKKYKSNILLHSQITWKFSNQLDLKSTWINLYSSFIPQKSAKNAKPNPLFFYQKFWIFAPQISKQKNERFERLLWTMHFPENLIRGNRGYLGQSVTQSTVFSFHTTVTIPSR